MKNIKITKFLKHSLVSKKWPEHLPAFKGKPYQECVGQIQARNILESHETFQSYGPTK